MEQDSNLGSIVNFEQQEILSDKEIFTEIWTSPRKVFRYIDEKKYDKYVTILLVLSGIARALNRAVSNNLGDRMSIWVIIGICIIVGGLFGWLTYYIYAVLISWTGKWLKGEGNTDSIIRIISYAMIPSVLALVILFPQISIYGCEMVKFDINTISTDLFSIILFFLFAFLEFILGIWTIVLCVIGISEVQKFSIGKSILNLLMPGLILLVLFLLILSLIEIF